VAVTLLAVADACVLVPAALNDFLMGAAGAGLFQMRWSDDILDEVRRALTEDIGIPEDKAERRIAAMKRALPDSLVTNHGKLIGSMPHDVDAKDRHVVAAAVESGASVIITSNLRDFPASALASYAIEAQSPDDFLMDLYLTDADTVTEIIKTQAANLLRNPRTPLQVIEAIGLQAPSFAALIRPTFDR
jgi:predicted nucleic acid-binding protein